jgi:NADPH2 dehydrogenase
MFDTPREMSDEDVRRMAERFGEAAGFLERVGFDGVEVHGAHGCE